MIEREGYLQSYFSQRSIDPLTISYEHFKDNYDATVLQVLEYLQLPLPEGFTVPQPKLKK
jgi:LPS sulfotransferase NodH